MKCNATTALHSSKVLLVPYSACHVPTYHAWMQDPDLQAATASEPLSLDEEFAMQQSWRTDREKLTFIVCLPHKRSNEESSVGVAPSHTIEGAIDDQPANMIGDVNLFLTELDSNDENGEEAGENINPNGENAEAGMVVGELELMIARADEQRKGYGRAALLVFTDYILSHRNLIMSEYDESNTASNSRSLRRLAYLRVKINASNTRSIRLFESVGFQQTVAGANYFNEVELRWTPNVDRLRSHRHWISWQMLRYNEARS